MTSPELIPEAEVTAENLQALFTRAYYSTSIDEDGDIRVQTDGPNVFIIIDNEKKHLLFNVFYGFKENVSLADKYELANILNYTRGFLRFSVPENAVDTLNIDYRLQYEQGILAFHIVLTVRAFVKDIPILLRLFDENDLVE